MQVLRVRRDAEAGERLHDHARGARRGRAPPARGDSLHRDPHGERREPARRLRLLRRHGARPPRGDAGRGPEALHRERDPPHDDALRAHARAGAARAAGGRARLAARRRRRGVRPARAEPRGAGQGAGRDLARDPPHGPRARDPDPVHPPLRPRRDLRGADRPHAAAARPPGRDGRLHGLHPARLPSREHRLRAARLPAHDRRRRPQDAGRLAPDARQHRPHQGLLDHDGPPARPGLAPLRRERHPGHRRARDDLPLRRRRDGDRAEDRGARPRRARRRPDPRPARHVLQRAAALG